MFFYIASVRDGTFGMPVLSRRFDEVEVHVIQSSEILFEYNAQHDCRHSQCIGSGERPLRQERIDSRVTEAFIVHNQHERYLINTHALHNAHLVRATLPRDLTRPIAFAPNREPHHITTAKELRATQESKRAGKTALNTEAQKQTTKYPAKRPRFEGDAGDNEEDEVNEAVLPLW